MRTVLRLRARIFAAIAIVGILFATSGADGEIFKKEDLLRGVTITHAQCDATAQALWLSVDGRDFCVRYYLSTAGGEGTHPVIVLQGDELGKINARTWTWLDTSDAKDMDSSDLVNVADFTSKITKTTAIYLARLGVDGTSGNHVFRGTQLELDLANAALDALKRRYGFEGFHFAGQSGGSKLAAAIAVERHDIGCMVLGSGRYDAPDVPKSKEPSHNYFDTTEHMPQLAQNRALRIYLVTDKADQRVPSAHQSAFADKLRRAGRAVPQYFVETTDELHHGTFPFTELVVAGCVLDRPEEEISHAVAVMTKRSSEDNERRRKEAGAKAAILAAARQAPTTPSVAASGKK
jgi:hypothetical protein